LYGRFGSQVTDVLDRSCTQIVQEDNLLSPSNQSFGQMRPDKSCTACDQRSHDSLRRGEVIGSEIKLLLLTGEIMVDGSDLQSKFTRASHARRGFIGLIQIVDHENV
jgi:hypothetical protein